MESTLASPRKRRRPGNCFEETGLTALRPPVYLQSCWWSNSEAPSRIRHYYWVETPAETPTAWSHVVSAGEDDKGMTFLLSFPRSGPGQPHGWIRLGRRAATPSGTRADHLDLARHVSGGTRLIGRWGAEVNLRAILLHMIQETARHNGHADILRETINGTTGH